MKPAVIPSVCSVALVAITIAGLGHWWYVQQLVSTSELQWPHGIPEKPAREMPAPPQVAKQPLHVVSAPPTPVPSPSQPAASNDLALQKMLELNQKTLEEVKRLSKENRDLRDQMAETNRDLMKLEFRVDTHSESFRPLPASSDNQETTLDVNRVDANLSSGVLPLLDEPLPLPTQ